MCKDREKKMRNNFYALLFDIGLYRLPPTGRNQEKDSRSGHNLP